MSQVENDDEYYEKVSTTDLTPSFKRKLTHSSDNNYNNNGYNYGSTGTYNQYDDYSTNDCACDYSYGDNGGYTYYDYYYNTYSYSYHASPDNGEPKEAADDVSGISYTTTYTYEVPSDSYYGYQYGSYYSVEECTCGELEWADFFGWISDFFQWLANLFSTLSGE